MARPQDSRRERRGPCSVRTGAARHSRAVRAAGPPVTGPDRHSAASGPSHPSPVTRGYRQPRRPGGRARKHDPRSQCPDRWRAGFDHPLDREDRGPPVVERARLRRAAGARHQRHRRRDQDDGRAHRRDRAPRSRGPAGPRRAGAPPRLQPRGAGRRRHRYPHAPALPRYRRGRGRPPDCGRARAHLGLARGFARDRLAPLL